MLHIRCACQWLWSWRRNRYRGHEASPRRRPRQRQHPCRNSGVECQPRRTHAGYVLYRSEYGIILIFVSGITLPSAEAQLRNIKSVYRRAGLSVNDTAYVECHGTGTQAGDWRELKAVSDAFCPPRSLDNPIYVGSVKTNIGHLEGCAGVAGLIKGILTVENGVIPKHLNFESPGNPDIDFDGWKVKVRICISTVLCDGFY